MGAGNGDVSVGLRDLGVAEPGYGVVEDINGVGH